MNSLDKIKAGKLNSVVSWLHSEVIKIEEDSRFQAKTASGDATQDLVRVILKIRRVTLQDVLAQLEEVTDNGSLPPEVSTLCACGCKSVIIVTDKMAMLKESDPLNGWYKEGHEIKKT